MTESNQDIWSQWLLQRRFGGDQAAMQAALTEYLYPWRDKVLSHAALGEGETLLDVGCGDGLIAFGALEMIKTSRVIFSDISQDLLNHAQSLSGEMKVLDRCQFIHALAEDLSPIENASVDAVTTRSVLIYVSAKQQAFDEFYRVLKPKGRLSIFEPINRFGNPEPPHLFCGYDVTPVIEITAKVKALFDRLQPFETDPMLDFDERDLIACAERAGFREIHLELQAEIQPNEPGSWETFAQRAWNPKIPTLEEAIRQVLTPGEADKLMAHLRPLVESGQGIHRSACAYVWAARN